MADFIAVIRRAVSGLSNNSPEMRVKVYEKARGAVMRQLENMSPRPSEDMFRRQVDKLEMAIREVEAEYAEALPAEDDLQPQEPDTLEETAPEELVAEQGEAVAEEGPAPVEEQPVEAAAEELQEPDPVAATPVWEPDQAVADGEPEAVSEDEVTEEAEPVEPEPAETPAYPAEPAFTEETGYEAEGDDAPVEEPIWADEPVAVEPGSEPLAAQSEYDGEPEVTADLVALPQDGAGPDFSEPGAEPHTEDEPAYGAPVASEATVAEDVSWTPYDPGTGEPVSGDISSLDDVVASDEHARALDDEGARDEFVALARGDHEAPDTDTDDSLDLLKWEPTTPISAEASDGGEADDGFDAWLSSGETRDEPEKASEASLAPIPDVTDLSALFAGVTPAGQPAESAHEPEDGDVRDDTALDEFSVGTQTKAYRVEPSRKRSFAPLVLGVLGLLAIAGGGYALWINKDSVGELVGNVMGPAEDVTPAATDEPAAETPGEDVAAVPAVEDPATAAPEAADGSASGSKFTQRLLSDGTEVDPGEAPASDGSTGRSVSEQNVASGGEALSAGAAGQQPAASAASDAALPPGGEKAIVYEERLGQATPTAINGSIVWARVEEQADGRPDPAIQGRLTIPSNGMTALITIKRNSDNSLPASHLIEIVFSVPADFEGGAIDGVQRVTMKRTEQERGEQLVAVTAKVTDDTYLVALNDFTDVVARNLDLLDTRQWIDVPVTYRNGRRALITLDKGATGTPIFDTVVKEWRAMAKSNGG